MENLILLAPPAAGKGTLAKELHDKYNYVHISMGDLLREEVAKGGELGAKIHEMQMAGVLVSKEIVFATLEKRLKEADCQNNGYILDGFPRSLEQAERYEEILQNIHGNIGMVINFTVPKEILLKRVVGRLTCDDCGKIYNIYSTDMKPLKDDTCDACGGHLSQRKDDNAESFEKRYQTYLDVTSPLIEYYSKKGILHTVDGSEGHIYTLEQVDALLLGDNVDNN